MLAEISFWMVQMMLTNDAVPEPVGGGRDGDTLGADGQLEDLSDDDPACGTPGAVMWSVKMKSWTFRASGYSRCKEEDEQTNEDDQDVACCLRVLRYGADNSNHKLANSHADSSPDEQGATTELLDGVE